MKKLLVLVALISSLIVSSVAHAEWTKVVKAEVGDTYYVDFERIKKHSGKIYYWGLIDYLKPQTNGVMSARIYSEAECEPFRFRSLNNAFYRASMGLGTIAHINNTPNKDWIYSPPNSISETLLSAVCNHVAYFKWTQVWESRAGNVLYVDFESIKKYDGKVYYWQLGDDSKPDKNGNLSFKANIEAECGRFRLKWLSLALHKGSMGSGKVGFSSYTRDKAWRYPDPDSGFERVLKAVCNHK
jgi:hypothetical protein